MELLHEVLRGVGDVRERMATREQVAALEERVNLHATEVAKVATLEKRVDAVEKGTMSDAERTRLSTLWDESNRAKGVIAAISTASAAGGGLLVWLLGKLVH